MKPELLTSLDAVLDRYDAILSDIWGVIHNGREIFPDAAAALARARAAGKIVLLISNVPKPKGPIPGQLTRLKYPREAWDDVVTSGDAIRMELAKRAPGPMLKIGPSYDAALWEGLNLDYAPLEQARFIGISGMNDEERETPADYIELLHKAKARDLEMLCANPDIVVRMGDKLIWCAGAVAKEYAALGGRVVMAGKPYAPIYDLAYREVERIAGRAIDKSRILAIGDGPATDIVGANVQGIDALFIASGIHGDTFFPNGALDAARAEAMLADEGAQARYIMPHLV